MEMNYLKMLKLQIVLLLPLLYNTHAQPTSSYDYEPTCYNLLDCQYKLGQVDRKVDSLEASMYTMHDELLQLKAILTKINQVSEKGDEKVDAIEAKVQDIKTKLFSNDSCGASIQSDLSEIKASVSSLQSASTFLPSDYSFYNNKRSWSSAESNCNDRGGRLVSTQSPEECAFVKWLISTYTNRRQCGVYWTGASKRNGDWVWGNTSEDAVFPWRNKEPTGDGTCAEIDSNGVFNDVPCSQANCFICEK